MDSKWVVRARKGGKFSGIYDAPKELKVLEENVVL
jgi:hypothetical protein|tara:strand:+ start:424 stop:528 length:105 start_codon:yes stop_codon:yes gene_type:complete